MTIVTQNPTTEQCEEAQIAISGRSTSSRKEGEITPPNTGANGGNDGLLINIAELEKTIGKLRKRAETAERQLEQTRKWRDQLREQNEVLTEEKAQALKIVDELQAERSAMMAENCALLSTNRDQAEHIESLESRLEMYRDGNAQDAVKDGWHKKLMENPKIELAHKVVLETLKNELSPDAYTRIYAPDLAKKIGASRQTVGKRVRDLVEWGVLGAQYEFEDATVPDKRGGTRNIKKTIMHLCLNSLAERPDEIAPTDGKAKHGGYGDRCKKCGSTNVRRIHHIQCLNPECGHETILYPLTPDQAADLREAEEAATAPTITVVHDEPQSPDMQFSHMTDNMQAAWNLLEQIYTHECSLRVREDGAWGIGCPKSWSDPQFEALKARVDALNTELRQIFNRTAPLLPWNTPCEWCGNTETAYDPHTAGRRVCACYIHPERQKQPAQIQSHKAVDFASRQIVQVSA